MWGRGYAHISANLSLLLGVACQLPTSPFVDSLRLVDDPLGMSSGGEQAIT